MDMISEGRHIARQEAARAGEYLTFRLGGEEYGVDIQKVQEIRSYEPPTRIPHAPPHIKGVVNLRGVIVPIVDLRTRLGCDSADYTSFTVVIVLASCFFTGLAAIIIAGTLTLGENRWIVGTLKALYRWPLFIPFIVAAQCMRTFLAKNGLMNNTFVSMGLMEPLQAVSFLDWRGIIATFVWKQTPFVALLLAGVVGLGNHRRQPGVRRGTRELGTLRRRLVEVCRR